jgi:hypothetical protein
MAQQRAIIFFPCRLRRHSSRTKKILSRRPPLRFGPKGCAAARLRLSDRHRGRNGAGSITEITESIMATIGTFKKVGNGYNGEIVTLSLQTPNVRIAPETTRANDNAPSHRVFVGRVDYVESVIMRSG